MSSPLTFSMSLAVMNIDTIIRKIDFVDMPRVISPQVYEQRMTEFVAHFQTHPAISAIYQLGAVHHPGISDLDLILVFRENGQLSESDAKFINCLDRDVFIHSPFAIPEGIFPFLGFCFYAANLRRISGKDSSFVEPGQGTDRQRLLTILSAEAAISRLSDLVFQLSMGTTLSARKMLLKIFSIRHNLTLFHSLSFPGFGKGDGRAEREDAFQQDLVAVSSVQMNIRSLADQFEQAFDSSGVNIDEVVLAKRWLNRECVQRTPRDKFPRSPREVDARARKSVDVHVIKGGSLLSGEDSGVCSRIFLQDFEFDLGPVPDLVELGLGFQGTLSYIRLLFAICQSIP